MKQKLLALLQEGQAKQPHALTPMLLMMLAAMSEEEVAEMLTWMRGLLDTILSDA